MIKIQIALSLIVSFFSVELLANNNEFNCKKFLRWTSDQTIPKCPVTGNTKLPETYPVAAFVVSDEANMETEAAEVFTETFVKNVLEASGERTPLFFLPVKDETFTKVQNIVRGVTSINSERQKRWLDSLIHLPDTPRVIWQQDYFEAFINSVTGLPVLRSISGYEDDHGIEVGPRLINDITTGCSFFKAGKPLPPDEIDYQLGDPDTGGNIEALPGGLCAYGDQQDFDTFGKHYCVKSGNAVVLNTSWLSVGHVDEVFAVVKNRKAASPCDFSVLLVSPRKGLQLLRQRAKEKFASFYSHLSGYSNKDLWYRSGGTSDPQNIELLCNLVSKSKKKRRCDGMNNFSNGDIYGFIRNDRELRVLNQLVDRVMEENRKTIELKLSERFPACSIKFIEVPGIFYGGTPVLKKGCRKRGGTDCYDLPLDSARSFLPSLVNLVQVEDTVLSPHPQTKGFVTYMNGVYDSLGLKVNYIDTYDYGHMGQGDLHCVTHAINICRP